MQNFFVFVIMALCSSLFGQIFTMHVKGQVKNSLKPLAVSLVIGLVVGGLLSFAPLPTFVTFILSLAGGFGLGALAKLAFA